MTTRGEMCDAILAAYRMHGLHPAYGMWLMAVEDDTIDAVDLELHARGSRVDEHAAQEIRDFDGVRRWLGKHGVSIKDPGEAPAHLRRIKPRQDPTLYGMPQAPSPPEKEDRALAMLHAFHGIGPGLKGR